MHRHPPPHPLRFWERRAARFARRMRRHVLADCPYRRPRTPQLLAVVLLANLLQVWEQMRDSA